MTGLRPKTAQQILWEQETEEEFQSWLVDIAKRNGWWVHFWPDWMRRMGMRSLRKGQRRGDRPWPDPGFCDVWCIHPERLELVVFECKREKAPPSAVSPEQRVWLQVLAAKGIDARVVRPRDRKAIEAILTGRADGEL